MRKKSDAAKKLLGTFKRSRSEKTFKRPLAASESLPTQKLSAKGQLPVVLVGPAPRTLPHKARAQWEALRPQLDALGTFTTSQCTALENLARSQARLADAALPASSFGPLTATVQRQLQAFGLAGSSRRPATPSPASPAPSSTSDADVLALLDPDDFTDDGFPLFLPLPPFTPEFFIMDAPGGAQVRPEAIAAARAEWAERERLRLGL
jgi:hypothetical protein